MWWASVEVDEGEWWGCASDNNAGGVAAACARPGVKGDGSHAITPTTTLKVYSTCLAIVRVRLVYPEFLKSSLTVPFPYPCARSLTTSLPVGGKRGSVDCCECVNNDDVYLSITLDRF